LSVEKKVNTAGGMIYKGPTILIQVYSQKVIHY